MFQIMLTSELEIEEIVNLGHINSIIVVLGNVFLLLATLLKRNVCYDFSGFRLV